jgi:hypothetical protein
VLDTTKQTIPPIEFPEKKPLLQPDNSKFFKRVSPEECGVESVFLKDYASTLFEDKKVILQSIMIIRNEKVIFEASKNLQDEAFPKATFSECKSIVALGIGILINKGLLKINERIIDIFAEKASPVAKMRLSRLTVKHLLNMTSPVLFNEGEAMVSDDWVKGYLNSDVEGGCGRKFRYNSMNTYMLSAIITEKTGLTLSEFLDSELFSPLGITNFYWEKCPKGLEKGGWGLYIRREDIAKIGLLVMQKGVWNGNKIISKRFIEEATTPKVSVSDEFGRYDYGLHIWCGKDKESFLFNGVFGQNLLGFWDSGIIIIVNCGNGDTFQQGRFFEITHKFFDREFADRLPENKKCANELTRFAKDIKNGNIQTRKIAFPFSKKAKFFDFFMEMIDSKKFEFSGANAASTGVLPLFLQLMQGNYTQGISSVEFHKRSDGLVITFNEKDETHLLNAGFNKPQTSVITSHGETFTVLSCAYLTENEDDILTLKIDCDFLETPFSRRFKFFFDGDTVFAVFSEVPGNNFSQIANVVAKTTIPNIQIMENVFTKFDGDYFDVKFEKAFSPKLSMKEIE